MSVEDVLARGREAAEALMADACTVTRESSHTTDEDTGVQTPTTETIYAGKCRIKQSPGVSRPVHVGEDTVYQLPSQVQLPISAVGFRVDDVVTVTASVNDPDLIGRRFWVRELFHETHATARRLGVEEVT